MDDQHAVIASLRNAVAALPEDLALRMHLASLLLGAGHRDEAVAHLGAVLQADPGNGQALGLLVSVQPAPPPPAPPPPAAAATPAPEGSIPAAAANPAAPDPAKADPAAAPASPEHPEFNWAEAEA